jgi:hypothetical protein
VDRPADLDAVARRFAEDGCVTLDTPLTADVVEAARAAVASRLPRSAEPGGGPYRYGETCSFLDPPLVEVIEHPFFEQVAGAALYAAEVRLFQTAITQVYPQPGAPWAYEEHVDVHYRPKDWAARPRRVICSFFLWLTDVDERRAPMMCRPGSHRLLAAQHRGGRRVEGRALADLPVLAYAAPRPIVARAGQVSVVTTAMVHGSSTNVSDAARSVLVMTYTARRVSIGLPFDQEAQRRSYLRELRGRLRPERAHIAAP